MPKEGSTIEFKHNNRKMRVPFVVYADFEALVKPIVNNEPDCGRRFTNPYENINPAGFVTKSNVLKTRCILKKQSFTEQRVPRRV